MEATTRDHDGVVVWAKSEHAKKGSCERLFSAVVATEGHKPADLTEITGTLVIRN
jgi:hypothetical protein